MTNYSEMTDEQLRLEVAKRKGWSACHGVVPTFGMFPIDYWAAEWPGGRTWITDKLPDWSTDISAAYDLEDEITTTQGQMNYSWHLTAILLTDLKRTPLYYDHIHATPRQRTIAWLAWKDAQPGA